MVPSRWNVCLIAGLVTGYGCAGGPSSYHYSRFRPTDSTDDAPAKVSVVYGTPRKRLDGVARALGTRDRLLSMNSKVDKHAVSPATIGKLKTYLVENDLTDVKVYVNHYDPKLQWKRLRKNSLVAPGWRYTVGVLDMAHYTLLPGRIFGGDYYSPYTNSLYIYSDVPAIVLHEAAFAKDIHSRKLRGSYAAVNELPVASLWRHSRGIRDVLGYARAKRDWDLERSTYQVLYPRTGVEIATAGAPLMSVWWGGPLLALGGAAGGHVTGRSMAAYRNSRREAEEPPATDAPEVQTASHEASVDGPARNDVILAGAISDPETISSHAPVDPPEAAVPAAQSSTPRLVEQGAEDAPLRPATQGERGRLGPFDWLAPGPAPSTDDAPQQLYAFHGYSSWHGIADGSGPNNNGFFYGANFGTRLGKLSKSTGIGAQIGGSGGLYDLNGRASPFESNQNVQQAFVTAGLFRRADELTNFSGGVAFDGMFIDNFGQYGASPFLGQLRYQVAYALNDQHEFGMWGTVRMVGDSQDILGPLSFRAVDQFNFFWHHKFAFGADATSWIGVPDHTKLGGNGSLGDYIFGGTLTAPLSPAWAVYMDLQYMRPSARIGSTAAQEEAFNLGIGLMFYPGRNSRTANVSGSRWRPYLPVANNGSFMIDTNRSF